MKALFIGLGSVGQRHLFNFQKLTKAAPNTILAYRATSHNNIVQNGKLVKSSALAGFYNIVEFSDLNKALDQKPEIGFICNPSSLHVETALKLAEKKMHLFIEKPVSINSKDIKRLEKLVAKNKLITFVGYQSRFNPCVQKIKSFIDSGEFGSLLSAQLEWSTYLPNFHPYEDYKKSYAASKKMGGNIAYTLSHELDLLHHWFGIPYAVSAVQSRSSKLGLEIDDTLISLFTCKKKKTVFPVSLHLSFSQGLEKRGGKILFEDAVLDYDLVTNQLKVTNHSKTELFSQKFKLERYSLFVDEMAHFVDCISTGKETKIPLKEGRISVSMAEAIERSVKSCKTTLIDQ